jgi:hypothetical protein
MKTSSLVLVTLPSGNQAIYDVQTHNLPRADKPESFRWPIDHGTQIAHEKDGRWYATGGWSKLESVAVIAIRASFPDARVEPQSPHPQPPQQGKQA